MTEPIIDKVLSAKRESASVEFKQTFDPTSKREWCEIVKDIVALANSGGGAIVFGADNRGCPCCGNLTGLSGVDPATVGDRVFQYTGVHCCQVEVREVQKSGQNLVVWLVGPVETPVVFSEPGTYPIEGGKQKTAFGRGTTYFRHGAKSEPGATEDLSRFLDRRLESIRKEWLGGVQKVVKAPTGSRVTVLPPQVVQSDSSGAAPIRITNDPGAPAYRVIDPDATHPHRQKELIAEVRKGLPKGQEFNSFDVVAVRYVHGIDDRPEFSHQPKFATRQYSQKLVEWILARYHEDPEFFQKARAKHRER